MLVWLLACSGAKPDALAPPPPVWVEARRVDEGQALVVHLPEGASLAPVEGLTPTQTQTGDDGTSTWELRGAKGSYVVEVQTSGEPVRLFLDIGVDGPTGGKMEDLVTVAPPPRPIWPWVVAGGVGLTAAAVGGFFLWQRFKPAPPPPPPEPADRVARREWAALRARTDLEPAVLAGLLSGVYRRYLEAVYGWPATSRTSREILDALAGDLTAVQLDCARRLLNAMDIVRFSDRSTHEGFFVALDADFEALLAARTRVPRA